MEWRPTATAEMLARRAALIRAIRQFFEARGFLEVETPLLSADVVVDRHLDPFVVPMPAVHGQGAAAVTPVRYLQTSPEFAMKRLLAAGLPAIFQICKAFRQQEHGRWHNPEFTMLEWYRAGDDLSGGMRLLAELAGTFLPGGPAACITYEQAFCSQTGLNPHLAETPLLTAKAQELRIEIPRSAFQGTSDHDFWLDLLWSQAVQPHLGQAAAVIVCDYPATQSALAQVRVRPDQPAVAERFELFYRGMELANGYHELLNPTELRQRNLKNNASRSLDGKAALPVENRLLAAMDHGLPGSSGVALGLDRLLAVMEGAASIGEVIAFPFDIA